MYHTLINYIDHMIKGNVPVILRKEDIADRVNAHPTPTMHAVREYLNGIGYSAMLVSCEGYGVTWKILIVHDKLVTFRAC